MQFFFALPENSKLPIECRQCSPFKAPHHKFMSLSASSLASPKLLPSSISLIAL